METKQKFIMYVDDDADDRELLAETIRYDHPDIDVLLCENGVSALQQLSALAANGSRLPCLIVLDINMPFLDGKQTYERLRQEPALKPIPVIVFSSSEKPQDKAMFNALGIEFFTKPSELAQLSSIVKHMVEVCC